MAFIKIKKLLKSHIGLNAESIGSSSIERAISHRMEHTGLSSEASYYSLLNKDEKEFDELVEEVVVPETWFFRNKTPFDALCNCVSEMSSVRRDYSVLEPIRLLSLPCATGEEPYSIAMALYEAGLGEIDFHIDGVDISKRAISKARRAIYGKHSFREDGVDIQDKYFKKTRSGFQLIPEIHDRVSFDKVNIITDSIFSSNEYYDIIFCRNLLIYFDRETQESVLNKLRMMLKPDGYLFVGHAETTPVSKRYFEKLDMPKSFAYRKKSTKDNDKAVNKSGSVDKLKEIYDQLVEVTRKDTLLSNKIKNPKELVKEKISSGRGIKTQWGKVERLIDGAHYDEAVSFCESILEGDPENADGYYYLGLISNLCGSHGGAESLLKKAIYLSPNHLKALSLSVVIAEHRGDDDNAEYFRRRETKARERNKR